MLHQRNRSGKSGRSLDLRSLATVALLGASFLGCDLIQRILIAPLARLRPGSRDVLLTRWQRFGARMVLSILRRPGGVRIAGLPRIPSTGGVLVLMNHQSLLDIPIVVASMHGVYPRILTRRRYGRGIPLVSHMTRLYRYPLVEPRATRRRGLKRLLRDGASSSHPLVVYPEGTRTRTGRIGRFKTLGLATLLATRRWKVYVVVADGMWKWARFKDFLGNLSLIRVHVECRGPFESPPRDSDPRPFMAEMREVMTETLREMRRVRGGEADG